MIRHLIVVLVAVGWLGWAPESSAKRPPKRKNAPAQAAPGKTPSQKGIPADDSSGVDSELEDIAQLFIAKGQHAKALEVYDELRLANPNNLDVLDMTIELCRKIPACTVRLTDLLGELSAFVERNPKSTRAREMLVDYALLFKEFKRARKAIKDLVKAKPNTIAHWLLLADQHEEVRHFRKLDALLADLLKRFPKSPQVWFRIADRAMAVNDNKRARFALARSKRLLKHKDTALRRRHTALEKELKRSIRAAREALYRDFRQDTRWADLEDDFAHSTYP